MSTASHNWSKVLMGERSHPPCEGWQGNVAGGNGFSQSAETEGRSLGAAVPRRTVPSVYPDSASVSCRSTGARTLVLFVCFPRGWQRHSEEVFDYYFGSSLAGMNRC